MEGDDDELELEREVDVEGDRARLDVFLFFFDLEDTAASLTGAGLVVDADDFSVFFCERSEGFSTARFEASLAVEEARCCCFSGFRGAFAGLRL